MPKALAHLGSCAFMLKINTLDDECATGEHWDPTERYEAELFMLKRAARMCSAVLLQCCEW